MSRLAVVVPTLDESVRLPRLLQDLERLTDLVSEVIVADGGSEDDTVEIARSYGANVLEVTRGRGTQLLAGAGAADAEWIFFVHADCRLTDEAARALRRFLERASPQDFAHFSFALEGRGLFRRVIEAGQKVRERLGGLVYGDQGLVVSRSLYERVGGHPDWVLMEDVGVIDRLRSAGHRVRLDASLPTSSRRYAREGGVRAWLRNVTLMVRFRMGASPDRLAHSYRPHEEDRREGAAVVVFAKAPVPGRVKTRLAADVGPKEATRIYRTIGLETVEALRGGPWSTHVYITPSTPEALGAVREWLGTDGIAFRTQAPGDLGDRMSAAARETLRRAASMVIVGTDIPGLDAEAIRRALRALETSDVVLGPATDGGYYLIALNEPRPELFEDIPWSTSEVLTETTRAAERAGLSVSLLDPMTDVDTLADLPVAYLAR